MKVTKKYLNEKLGIESVEDFVFLTGLKPTGDVEKDRIIILESLKIEFTEYPS